MNLANALKKLEAARYKIATNGSFYSAILGGTEITFVSTNGVDTSKFSCEFPSSCSATYGMTLKAAMS